MKGFRVLGLFLLFALMPQRSQGNEVLWEQLHALYPFLSPAEVVEKAQAARSPFEFFRSFVAVYYDVVVTRPELTHSFRDVRKQMGWCVGDAHPENFGILLNQSGKAVFTVNDWDDTGPCPVYADVMRFLAAAYSYNPRLDLSALRASYLRTLMGGDLKLSPAIEALRLRSEQTGFIISKNELTAQGKLKRPKEAVELTAHERDDLIQTLKPVGLGVADAYRIQRRQGGSFGSWRVRILSRLNGRPAFMELKEILPSGMLPLISGERTPSARDRIGRMLELLFGTEVPHGIAVVPFEGKHFLMRPRWQTNVGVDLDRFSKQLSSDDLFKVLQDQAEVLGVFHRRSTMEPEHYARAMAAIDADAWTLTAQALADEVAAIQKDLFR